MSDTFSKRHGYGDCSKGLVFENAPQKLRIGLWNLIEDYVRRNALPDFGTLYTRLTAHFRFERSGINYLYEMNRMVLVTFKWFEIFDLVEFLFSLVQYYGYDEYGNWCHFPEKFGDIRYQYTKDINDLLSSENIGWRLKKGHIERLGSEVLDREVIEKARKLLLNPSFIGPNDQFNKALEFFSKRPEPDKVNCVKEAVCALEGLCRVLLKDENITLGVATNLMVGKKIIRKPLDKAFHALYGFVSTEPGPRHGAHVLPSIDIAETEFVLYNAATCMLFLADRFGVKPHQEGTVKPQSSGSEIVSDFPTEEEVIDLPADEEPPEFPDDEVPF
jgi:hypothetical protein